MQPIPYDDIEEFCIGAIALFDVITLTLQKPEGFRAQA